MQGRHKLTIFNRAYPPNQQATAALLAELAADLSAERPVEVVCCGPRGEGDERASPAVVRRGPYPRAARRTRLVQATEYLLALGWSLLRAARLDRRGTALVWTDPPLMETLVGALLVLRRVPYVQLLQDWHLPLVESRGGMLGRVAAKLWWPVQKAVFERATRLVCISDDTPAALAARGLRRKCDVIENWCPGESLTAAAPKRVAPERGPVVVQYYGNLGVACDLDAFEKALPLLGAPEHLAVVFRGGGSRAFRVEALTGRFPNVFKAQRVPESELAAALTACDAHLILMPTDCLGVVFPSKIYAAMAVGRPVIVSAPRASAIHDLVARIGCGLTAPSEEPAALAAVLDRFAALCVGEPHAVQAMGERGSAHIRGAGARGAAAARWRELLGAVALHT